MFGFIKGKWLYIPLLVLTVLILGLCPKWVEGNRRGGQTEAEPFRIAGNLHYVGASDVTAYLITGPEGHVLIDGGYPLTPPLIMASIAKLGFKITDVKIILNSHAHFDHAGGLAELQQASGAQVWISEGDADAVASGEGQPIDLFPMKILSATGVGRFTPPRIDRRFKDGDTVRLGSTRLIAHVTAGHTRGCTSWEIPVRDGKRTLRAVSICSLEILHGMRFTDPDRYPGIRADFERSFKVLRDLKADIFLMSHARAWGRYRKYVASLESKDPVSAFIDREGYLTFIDSGEARFRETLARQQTK